MNEEPQPEPILPRGNTYPNKKPRLDLDLNEKPAPALDQDLNEKPPAPDSASPSDACDDVGE
jgi:hypothetical protein